MNKIIKNIKDQIPKYLSGFSFRKSQEIYIPYLEIGIECLIRDVNELNLFFETILKLIQIEVKEIYEISRILGVSFEITKEAVVDMVDGGYIGVSENILRITKKGEEVLKTKQLVEIKKKNINKIMIDLITGDIYDGNELKYFKIKKYDVCLEKQIDVSRSFLDSNYTIINNVFKKQQESYVNFGRDSVNKELYKIVNISYENLVYIKNELLIYENDNSDEVQLQIKNDSNDRYLNCLCEQLKEGSHPCLESVFEKDFKFVREHSYITKSLDENLVDVTGKLCSDLRYIEDLNDFNQNAFMQKRYMITDKEYINYFTFSDEIVFDKLIIITNRINSILTNSIFTEIKRISLRKPVVLLYDANEFNATNTVNYHLEPEKNNQNLLIMPSENIKDTKIFFDTFLEINIEEKIINAFGKAISYKLGILNFDNNDIKENLKSNMLKYNIDEVLNKNASSIEPYKNVKKKRR